jgi:hypothetical protein
LIHISPCAVYQPNTRAKSDADILRDAKLEAMGMPPQDDSPRRSNQERTQTATDEMVILFFIQSLQMVMTLMDLLGHGTVQEANAKMNTAYFFRVQEIYSFDVYSYAMPHCSS